MDYALQDLTDGERVVLSANLLDTSEFEIFRRAYLEWYGRDLDTKALGAEFSVYLHTSQAPPWVRHYSRNLLQECHRTIYITSYGPTSGRWFEWLLNTRVARMILG